MAKIKENEEVVKAETIAESTENDVVQLMEDANLLQEKLTQTEEFAKNNGKLVIGAAIAIAVLVGGVMFFQWNKQKQNAEAQKELFPAQFYIEKDSLVNKALQGDNNNSTIGMLALSDKFSGTKAADLAGLYIGVAKLKEGKYDEAIKALENFSADDYLLQARAYSLIGDAYSEKKEYGDAAKYYEKASNYYPNEQFTPTYLLKLGQVQEANNNPTEAIKAYQQIVEKFELAPEKPLAEKLKIKIEAKTQTTK
jgi:TolA-binding protein